jgi:hypothetical protein
VDEMTHLDQMTFPFSKGTPKQQLVMREFKKWQLTFDLCWSIVFPQSQHRVEKGMLQYNIIMSI